MLKSGVFNENCNATLSTFHPLIIFIYLNWKCKHCTSAFPSHTSLGHTMFWLLYAPQISFLYVRFILLVTISSKIIHIIDSFRLELFSNLNTIHDKNIWLLCVLDYLSVDGLLGCFSFLSTMINISINDDI